MSVSGAASSGDRVLILQAIRDNLAARLDDPAENAAAAVARELRMTLDALAQGQQQGADVLDELRARRANTTGGKRAAKGSKSGS